MKKVVVKLDLHDDKAKHKAMKVVSTLSGIESIEMDMKDKKLTVVGDVDPIVLISKLRKSYKADILSVGPAKEPEKKADPKKAEAEKKEEPKKEGAKKPEEEKKKDASDPMAELMKAYKDFNPHPSMSFYPQPPMNFGPPHPMNFGPPPPMNAYYYVTEEEDPIICAIS